MTLKIAVPNKGRLSESTLELFQKAGLKVEAGHDRRLYANALDGNVSLLFVRASDIPEYVQDGVVDLGVTGLDIVEETAKDVERLMDLRFGACRLVLAVPADGKVRRAADLTDGTRVATSFPRLTRAWFERLGRKVTLVEVSGATEVTTHLGVADGVRPGLRRGRGERDADPTKRRGRNRPGHSRRLRRRARINTSLHT